MGKKHQKKKKKVTPTDAQLITEIEEIKKKFPESGIKKTLVKLKVRLFTTFLRCID